MTFIQGLSELAYLSYAACWRLEKFILVLGYQKAPTHNVLNLEPLDFVVDTATIFSLILESFPLGIWTTLEAIWDFLGYPNKVSLLKWPQKSEYLLENSWSFFFFDK